MLGIPLPGLLFLTALASPPGAAQGSDESPTIDTGRVSLSRSSLYYEAAGAGPTVILLHAAYLDRRMWDDQFAFLARSHRVIRYDARGFGRSGPADAPYSPVEDLEAILDSLGLARATLVGSSFGGTTAVDFTIAHPDRVDGLVLVGSGLSGYAWPPDSLQEPWRVEARTALVRGDTTGVARAWLHSTYLKPASEHAALAARLLALLGDNVAFWRVLLRHGEGFDTAPAPPALGRLGRIRSPTLIIIGGRDAPPVRAIAEILLHQIPGARQVRFPAAGHLPNLEQPRVFTWLLVSFLDKL